MSTSANHPPIFHEASPEANLVAFVQTGPPVDQASDVILFVHGITANSRAWSLVSSRLPNDVATCSVDLRGRAGSSVLPGPWGMAAHAGDLARLLAHLGVGQPVLLVGHSMGAFVVSTFALLYPDWIRGAVLVDGGVELTRDRSLAEQDALRSALGPALERLSQTYANRAEYRHFWQTHPAFNKTPWTTFLDDYIHHDLGGSEPLLVSRVNAEAVLQDGSEIFSNAEVVEAALHMACPTELLRAERGLFDQPEPLISATTVQEVNAKNAGIRITTIPQVNHYTIVMGSAGADAVAAAIRRQL